MNLPYLRRLHAVQQDDYVRCRVSIPTITLGRINRLKVRHGLRSRNAVINCLIREARNHYALADFQLPPEPSATDPMCPLIPSIQADHAEFLFRLQRRFRGAALGAALEAIVETVGDVVPSQIQLELFRPEEVGLNGVT